MKKWTVVVEIHDYYDDEESTRLDKAGIENQVSRGLKDRPGLGFQIMETIPAPYGPQHPDGVFIVEANVKITDAKIIRKDSKQ